MGIPLFLIALVLCSVLAIVALLHTIVGAIRYGGKFRYVNAAFLRGAKALDVFGNVAFATLLNDLFSKREAYHYGRDGETISSATGKNWVLGKLTFLGKGLAGTLNMLDTDHCWKYIEGDTDLYHQIGHPGKVKWFYTAGFCIVSAVLLSLLVWLHVWILF